MSDDILKPESREEYQQDAEKYFQGLEGPKGRGVSADDTAVANRHLPSEARHKELERLTKGFSKTSRSGAFTNNANAVPAIFPSGLKQASDFIDEMSSGKYKEPEVVKPPSQQIAPTGHFEMAAAVIENLNALCLPSGKNSRQGPPFEPIKIYGVDLFP